MKKEDAVKSMIDLPEGIPAPGDLIQVQITVPGGGEQVEVVLERVAKVGLIKSFEDDRFQRIVSIETVAGTILTYDHKSQEWFLVSRGLVPGGLFGQNSATPVCVFRR